MNSSAGVVGALPPPPGTTANFINPPYDGTRLVVTAIVCPALAIPFILLRLYTKRFLVKRLHLDDCKDAIILGLICAIAYSETTNGLGRHRWDVPFDKYKTFFKVGAIFGAMSYSMGTLFIKASIALFYLRFSIDRNFRIVTFLVLFVAVTYCLLGTFSFAYLCKPVRSFWDFTVPGTCGNLNVNFIAAAVLNVFTDIALLLLPIWLLKPLRLDRFHKIGIIFVFMTGSLVCGVSIVRLAALFRPSDWLDSTWTYVINMIWCLIELYTGIICACLPSLRIFAKFHIPSLQKFLKKKQNRDLPSSNRFPITNRDLQQQQGHVFVDSANESSQATETWQSQISSNLSSVVGGYEHEKGFNAPVETSAAHT